MNTCGWWIPLLSGRLVFTEHLKSPFSVSVKAEEVMKS